MRPGRGRPPIGRLLRLLVRRRGRRLRRRRRRVHRGVRTRRRGGGRVRRRCRRARRRRRRGSPVRMSLPRLPRRGGLRSRSRGGGMVRRSRYGRGRLAPSDRLRLRRLVMWVTAGLRAAVLRIHRRVLRGRRGWGSMVRVVRLSAMVRRRPRRTGGCVVGRWRSRHGGRGRSPLRRGRRRCHRRGGRCRRRVGGWRVGVGRWCRRGMRLLEYIIFGSCSKKSHQEEDLLDDEWEGAGASRAWRARRGGRWASAWATTTRRDGEAAVHGRVDPARAGRCCWSWARHA